MNDRGVFFQPGGGVCWCWERQVQQNGDQTVEKQPMQPSPSATMKHARAVKSKTVPTNVRRQATANCEERDGPRQAGSGKQNTLATLGLLGRCKVSWSAFFVKILELQGVLFFG